MCVTVDLTSLVKVILCNFAQLIMIIISTLALKGKLKFKLKENGLSFLSDVILYQMLENVQPFVAVMMVGILSMIQCIVVNMQHQQLPLQQQPLQL